MTRVRHMPQERNASKSPKWTNRKRRQNYALFYPFISGGIYPDQSGKSSNWSFGLHVDSRSPVCPYSTFNMHYASSLHNSPAIHENYIGSQQYIVATKIGHLLFYLPLNQIPASQSTKEERKLVLTFETMITEGVILLVRVTMLLGMIKSVASGLDKVGGKYGWTQNVNYTDWAVHRHFYVGDWLCE